MLKNDNMRFLLLELILADHLVKNGNMRFLLLELILADHLVKNGNMRFLLLELILADHLADLSPLVEASSGQEWQYEISIVSAHLVRSPCRYISPFLLLELLLADQVQIYPPPSRCT